MAINFNFKIEKKDLWLLAAIFVFLAGVTYVIAYGGNNPSIHGHSAGEIEGVGFGDWTRTGTLASGGTETMVAGHVYQAQKDGIITASGGGSMIAYVDSDLTLVTNSDSSVLRAISSDSTNAPSAPSFTFPVKKGDYFKITNQYYGTVIIWWVPLGS